MLGPSGCPPRRRGEDRVHDVSDLQAGSTGEAVGGQGRLQMARELGRSWWVLLLLGIVWVLFVLFVVLSWFLVVMGIFHVVGALAGPKREWWWMTLLLGIAEFLLGAWAAGYPGRSLLVFVNLVGFYALIHGFTEIFGAFTVREVARHPERA